MARVLRTGPLMPGEERMTSKRRRVGGAITALGLGVGLALWISATAAFVVVVDVHRPRRRPAGGGGGGGGGAGDAAPTTDASRGGRSSAVANPSSTLFRVSRLWTQSEADSRTSSTLEGVLVHYGYGRRLMEIAPSELPVLAEVYVGGAAHLARIVAFHTDGATTSSNSSGSGFDPKVTVETLPGNASMVVDLGQITTVLKDMTTRPQAPLRRSARPAPPVVERTLDQLYHSHVGRGRDQSKGGLSKKHVKSVVERFPPNHQPHVDQILRHALKAGSGLSRVVDAPVVRAALFPFGGGPFRGTPSTTAAALDTTSVVAQTHVAVDVLSRDAADGRGRFKRWPCAAVARTPSGGLCFLNGGWVVVDRNVRAGSEARQFAAAEMRPMGASSWTPADLRIAQRLECLAMGEALSSTTTVKAASLSSSQSRQRSPSPISVPEPPTSLERDVRETLRAMNLPATPGGAKEALVRVGRWMGTGDFTLVEPWSKFVLEAATWYSAQRLSARDDDASRVDLTGYPSLCVDAQRTSFRDDAMGLRPRASTGRTVIPEASKWEVMVHIVDVTDIYCDSPEPNLAILRQASKSRGTSRYDLPLGPLHLLPPRVLESLSLSRRLESSHRCITVWAYIDERDGSLLDVGLERTLIRSPILLSFREATAVLERTDPTGQRKDDTRIRLLLMALERSLSRWVDHRMRASESAQKREIRLSRREQDGTANTQYLLDDSGRSGFQRSRGHRLVDASLDLYSCGIFNLLREAKAPVPESKGADSSRGGRLATAPLRRYVDGEAQRQAVAVMCQQGRILTATECKEIGKASNQARNAVKNIRATRK